MVMMFYLFFFLLCFGLGFVFCFPFGPASLEMVRLALKRHRLQAFSMALGAASGDGLMALLALTGMKGLAEGRLLQKWSSLFTIAGALMVGALGINAWRHASGNELGKKKPAASTPFLSHWSFTKGMALSLFNPATLASWILALQALHSLGFILPRSPWPMVGFFLFTMAGYLAYFSLMIAAAFRVRHWMTDRRQHSMQRGLAVMLIVAAFFILLWGMKHGA